MKKRGIIRNIYKEKKLGYEFKTLLQNPFPVALAYLLHPYGDCMWADNCGPKEGSSSAIITEFYWEEKNISDFCTPIIKANPKIN